MKKRIPRRVGVRVRGPKKHAGKSFIAKRTSSGKWVSVDDVYVTAGDVRIMVDGEEEAPVAVYRGAKKVKNVAVTKLGATLKAYVLKRIEEENRITQEYLIAQSAGISPDIIPLPRYVPIRIYLEKGVNSELVTDSVTNLAKELDIAIANQYEPELGSWFQKLIGRTNDAIPKDELLRRLEKAERALELAKINKVQSEIDNNLGTAASSVIQALKGEDNAAIQLSSLLIVKRTDDNGKSVIATRTLTQKELVYLERNPSLVQNPKDILELLDSVRKTEDISISRLKDER